MAIDLAALLAVGMAKPPNRLFSPSTWFAALALTCNFAKAALRPYRLPFVSDPSPSRRLGIRASPDVFEEEKADGRGFGSVAVVSIASTAGRATLRAIGREGAAPGPSELG